MRRLIRALVMLVAVLLVPNAWAQDIVTASEYFDTISAVYGEIEDYQSNVAIEQEDSFMTGTLYFKRPNLLRIDFANPEEQVLAVDGENLTIYIPHLNVTMVQKLDPAAPVSASPTGLATSDGLRLLKNKYSVAFLEGPDPMPLEEGSDEMVMYLKFEWKSIDEGFRQLEIAVNQQGLIRRIIGITKNYEELRLDFTETIINQDFPEGLFRYESPADSNVIYNFIEPEE